MINRMRYVYIITEIKW